MLIHIYNNWSLNPFNDDDFLKISKMAFSDMYHKERQTKRSDMLRDFYFEMQAKMTKEIYDHLKSKEKWYYGFYRNIWWTYTIRHKPKKEIIELHFVPSKHLIKDKSFNSY